ncbi:MAG: TraR/DksA C4-type zinc finger protein [Gammaproteobacteria bacterium]|nr:TraR/DksA C4-type zinc finger protein [Gammaproteobacteria bacterium]
MDIVDTANATAELFMDIALSARKNVAKVTPIYNPAGARICIDCLSPIEKGRLAALPNAARCAHCQHLHEQRSRK